VSRTLLLLVLALVNVAPAIACSCVEFKGSIQKQVKNALHRADFVAEIEVTSAAEIAESRVVSGKRWSWDDRKYHDYTENRSETRLQAEIKVIRQWKGAFATSSVSTSIGMPACGLPFQQGQRVLLYAYIDEDTGRLVSDSCTRTNLTENAEEDLNILNRPTKPKELPSK
jgi:hypothetical protein